MPSNVVCLCYSNTQHVAQLYNIALRLHTESSTRCVHCGHSEDGNIWAAGHEFESCAQLGSGAFAVFTEPLAHSTAKCCSDIKDSRG